MCHLAIPAPLERPHGGKPYCQLHMCPSCGREKESSMAGCALHRDLPEGPAAACPPRCGVAVHNLELYFLQSGARLVRQKRTPVALAARAIGSELGNREV